MHLEMHDPFSGLLPDHHQEHSSTDKHIKVHMVHISPLTIVDASVDSILSLNSVQDVASDFTQVGDLIVTFHVICVLNQYVLASADLGPDRPRHCGT